MAEYIDRDALLAEAKRISGPMTGDGWDNWGVYALINRQPAADVVEKRSCNTCQWYEGVHNTPGLAPCSFWNIGGVMWNDFCLRWKGESDG